MQSLQSIANITSPIQKKAFSDILEAKQSGNLAKLRELCAEFDNFGLYDKTGYMLAIGADSFDMTMAFGPDWFIYRYPLLCRHCSGDLRDTSAGPPFKLEIHSNQNGVERCECPHCGREL